MNVITKTARTIVEQSHWIPPSQSSTSLRRAIRVGVAAAVVADCGALSICSATSAAAFWASEAELTAEAGDSVLSEGSRAGSQRRSECTFMRILPEPAAANADIRVRFALLAARPSSLSSPRRWPNKWVLRHPAQRYALAW